MTGAKEHPGRESVEMVYLPIRESTKEFLVSSDADDEQEDAEEEGEMPEVLLRGAGVDATGAAACTGCWEAVLTTWLPSLRTSACKSPRRLAQRCCSS